MATPSDETLLAGLASGDPEAALAFVRTFQARVYGLALAILGDRAAAQDVAQEAFVRAWRNGASYDPRRGSVTTWLLTITRNASIDLRRVRRPVPVDIEDLLALPSPGLGPEDSAMAADDTERVRSALRRLSPEQRRAVVRAAYLGETAREISSAEGIPLGTAKTRIRDGMLRLHRYLATTREPRP